jgi:uncharacterized membrane protein YpjA
MRLLHRAWPVLCAANAAGATYGVAWYGEQLWQRPPWLWPFVADCPLAAVLCALAVNAWGRGGRPVLLFGLAKGYAVYFGAWTLAVLVGSRQGDMLLFVAHALLLLEGVVFWNAWPHSRRGAALTVCLLAANVACDYGLGVHPALPAAFVPAALRCAVLLLVPCAAALSWLRVPGWQTAP